MPGILQEQIGVMYPLITRDFAVSQISGAQTNTALLALSTHNGATISALNVNTVAFPFGGSIVGMSISASTAPGGTGTISVVPSVNGVPISSQSVSMAALAQSAIATWDYGLIRFNPGDTLGVALTQPATLSAVYDAIVTVYIVLNEARF